MGAVGKTFSVLLIAFAVLLSLSSLGAVIGGSTDNQAADEECGRFGSGCDQESEEVNNALIAGGAAGMGVGLILLTIGVVLVATDNKQQQQQLVITGDGLTQQVTTQQQGAAEPSRFQNPRVVVGLAAGAIVIMLIFLTVGTGNAGLANPFAENYPQRIAHNSYGGTISNSASVGGVEGQTSERPWQTHERTEEIRLWVNWSADQFGPSTLDLRIYRATAGAEVLLLDAVVTSGQLVRLKDEAHGQLEEVTLRIEVGPSDQAVVQSQTFVVHLDEFDLRPR
jgi:hypothetical protein